MWYICYVYQARTSYNKMFPNITKLCIWEQGIDSSVRALLHHTNFTNNTWMCAGEAALCQRFHIQQHVLKALYIAHFIISDPNKVSCRIKWPGRIQSVISAYLIKLTWQTNSYLRHFTHCCSHIHSSYSKARKIGLSFLV